MLKDYLNDEKEGFSPPLDFREFMLVCEVILFSQKIQMLKYCRKVCDYLGAVEVQNSILPY